MSTKNMSDCVYPCSEGFIADTLNISKKLLFLEIGNAVSYSFTTIEMRQSI